MKFENLQVSKISSLSKYMSYSVRHYVHYLEDLEGNLMTAYDEDVDEACKGTGETL